MMMWILQNVTFVIYWVCVGILEELYSLHSNILLVVDHFSLHDSQIFNFFRVRWSVCVIANWMICCSWFKCNASVWRWGDPNSLSLSWVWQSNAKLSTHVSSYKWRRNKKKGKVLELVCMYVCLWKKVFASTVYTVKSSSYLYIQTVTFFQ